MFLANAWFRLYSELAEDPKMQIMPETFQRRLIMHFCLRCRGQLLGTFRETEIAFHMRVSLEELAQTKQAFLDGGFIDNRWNLINWDARQYISDSSTERVRKYREGLKQSETFLKQDETVSVTAPEQIQNRTETETEQKKPVLRAPKKRASPLGSVD